MLTRSALSRRGTRLCLSFVAAMLIAFGLAACEPPPSGGTFTDAVVFSGLTEPTTFRFASDGRIFVAEKRGIIKVFDSLTDTSPTIFADLRTEVDNYWDRGLLGLALDPGLSTEAMGVRALHARRAARWDSPGVERLVSDPARPAGRRVRHQWPSRAPRGIG